MILEHMYIAWYSYERHEVDTWWKYGLHIDIRVGLFTISTDHLSIV